MCDGFLFASDIFWVLLKLDFRVFHTRKLSYFFSLLFFLGGVVAKRGVRISHVTLSQYYYSHARSDTHHHHLRRSEGDPPVREFFFFFFFDQRGVLFSSEFS